MPPVMIPLPLAELLAGSPHNTPVSQLADKVGDLVGDNKTPFFPAYTDHGVEHLERVLDAAVRLVPAAVWEAELLTPADAAVLTCACLLHDIAMHLREPGFVALVSDGSEYLPRPWFGEDHPGRPADAPWPDAWADFQREARHFGPSQLERILGPGRSEIPAVAHQQTLEPSTWDEGDHLLIGEFLRRHHARVAHEIAIHGFPGAGPHFPVLVKTMPLASVAEAIGVVARSHNEPLRRMLDYLEAQHGSNQRPAGAALVYHMGLLRVADYLQIDADRSPPLLLMLKDPHSPLSVQEWDKHRVIAPISWRDKDPMAINIEVEVDHGLRTHLALKELLADLQHELDVTAAVLSEVYSSEGDAPLRLTKQRVRSNIDKPALHAQLDYVPRHAVLRSDPDLFRLVIRDLYGDQPAVAGRELVQNAVDAVRARRMWEDRQGQPAQDLCEQEADIVLTIVQGEDDHHELRVSDRGIGMTPDLVVDYFLSAGASFGPTRMEIEGLDRDAALRTLKAGRFGIGAFAAFLLGPEIRVTTRHAEMSRGITFRARLDEPLVELRWDEHAPVGTEIVVPFHRKLTPPENRLAGHSELYELLNQIQRLYRLADPEAAFVLVEADRTTRMRREDHVPAAGGQLPHGWRRVGGTGFDDVLWRMPRMPVSRVFDRRGSVVHNGLLIALPSNSFGRSTYSLTNRSSAELIQEPDLAVYDSRHLLPLTLSRFSLQSKWLPFEDQLLRSMSEDIVAHALAGGMRTHPASMASSLAPVVSRSGWFPLLPGLLHRLARGAVLVEWAAIDDQAVLDDLQVTTGNPVSWRTVPHRLRLSLDKEHAGSSGHSTRSDGLIERILETSQRIQKTFGARHRCSLVRAMDGPIAPRLVTPWHYLDGRRVEEPVEGISATGPYRTFLADPDEVPDLTADIALLSQICDAADPSEGRATIALTLFDTYPAKDDDIADIWLAAVGGALPRSARKRAEAAEQACRRRPSLRPLVKKWERELKTNR
jgi:molecular chaperone HtpG